MGVHCLTGRRGSGKTTRCVETIRKLLGTGAPILFLVPEQDTVEAEMHLAGALNLSVFWNLEVLSLKRLAQRIGQNAGGGAQVTLSDAGRAMALKGAMIGLRGGMKYYRSGASGAADLMGDLMVELRRGESDATQLRLAADKLPPEGALAQKLYDLAAVYEEYDGRIAGKYQDGEDALRRSAQLCGQCGELKDAYVFADGFDVLPRTALRLLAALGGVCREVYATFDLCAADAPDAALYDPVRFSAQTLKKMCGEGGVTCEFEALADRELPNAELNHLSRQLFSRKPQPWTKKPENVHLVYAKDPYMESERAAGYLFEKIRTEGLRCRDMAVLCPHIDLYGQRLEMALRRRGLRAYVDRRISAAEHPAARYLLAALAGAARYYRMDDMLRALKSGYAGVSAREADRLELYAMERGLEGRLWERPIEEDAEDVRAEDADENAGELRSLEEIRQRFAGPIAAFRRGGLRRTVQAFCEAVVNLMQDDDLSGQLAAQHRLLEQAGDPAGQQALRQVQRAINSVLDQAVELCGEEEMPLRDFIRLIEAGLQATDLGSIPMEPDAVYVGEVGRYKGRGAKVLIVLGVNADAIPARRQEMGLLTEDEKVLLLDAAKQAGVEMHLNLLAQRAAIERFALSGVLASPERELVLSFPSMDLRGAALRKSPLIAVLEKKVFPKIETECGVMGDDYVYAGAKQSVREKLGEFLREKESGAAWDAHGEGLLAAFEAVCPEDARALEERVRRRREEERLDEAAARALYLRKDKMERYGVEGLVASISQLETFAQCPFAHFLDYGIRPKELKEPEMDARDRGTLEHRAIEQFVGKLYQQEGPVTDEMAEQMMMDILQPLFDEDGRNRPQEGLTQAGHRQIRRTMGRMSRIMAMHRNLSAFRAVGEEVNFTPQQILPLELENGEKVYLEGKIDRVDMLEMGSKRYARVIDYKSGNTTLNLEDVYYGLRLQLFLYLDAVLSMRQALPAGVFYQKLSQGAMRLDGARADESFEAKQNKKLSLSGFVLRDKAVVEKMCSDPEQLEQLLPLTPRRQGGKALAGEVTETSKKRTLTEKEFSILRRHTRRKLTEMAGELLQGHAEVSPMHTSNVDACKYCKYSSVCGFEGAKNEGKMDNDEVLAYLRREDRDA